jgi:hypothetical protein
MDNLRNTSKKRRLVFGLLILDLLFAVYIVRGFLIFKSPGFIAGTTSSELLFSTIHLSGTKEFITVTRLIPAAVLRGTTTLHLTYHTHGLCLLSGPASEIAFHSKNGQKYSVSLSDYGQSCYDGVQSVDIPLNDFAGLTSTTLVKDFSVSVWEPTSFTLDVTSALVYDAGAFSLKIQPSSRPHGKPRSKPTATPTSSPPQPTATPSPTATPIPSPTPDLVTPTPSATVSASIVPTATPIPTPTPTPQIIPKRTWNIQSVSSMKVTKDVICSPRSLDFIQRWVDQAVRLGVNYISIETPYDNPSCGDSVTYTQTWIEVIRSRNLHVWHRHMPLAFEGIYNVPKNNQSTYVTLISDYIRNHPTFFNADDIFTPIPEPQNGGISGITYCPQSICQFPNAAAFNQWLRDAIDQSKQAFSAIGLPNMQIGYYGFDGFVAWGDNNPDWNGIIEDATIAKMGNITIDHYPEAVGDTMDNDLNELQAKYPSTPIIIGEWGTITPDNLEQQVLNSMQAAKRPNVVGFNYWHLGMGGNEALINDDFSQRIQYDEVQSFFIIP